MSNDSKVDSLSVLVVDDDELMLCQINLVLQQTGINQVSLLSNGHSALEKIHLGESYDIIFLDLNMPEMDGIEVIRNLAARRYRGAIALFSGEDIRILKTAESLASAHNLYIIGSLSKPVTIESLDALLSNLKPRSNVSKLASIPLVTPEELQSAIERKQIQTYFQPKVRLADKSIASAEVLARWSSDDRGMVSPIAFIPIAENNKLIDSLTMVIIEQALSLFGQWRREGYEFSLAINLSADTLGNVDLPDIIGVIAAKNDIPCKVIILEVTESRLLKNLTTSLDVLTRLRLKGFGLSIDDFGTDYSSMDQLKKIPFTELKIDRAFVHGVSSDPAAYAILESSAALAKKLNMSIVAEGVEDEADWDAVASVGCDLVQGFYIKKPMCAEDFERWLRLSHGS